MNVIQEPLPYLCPDPLGPGDLIAMLAPASAVKEEYCRGAKDFLEAQGFRVRLYPSASGGVYGSYAASFRQRVEECRDALRDPEVKCILCARGGYGCVQLLEELTDELRANPKWIVGFSDISALHALAGTHHIRSLHAPMAKHLTEHPLPDPCTRAWLDVLTTGRQPEIRTAGNQFSSPGKATGRLIGGNLAVLNSLAGTPYDIMALSLREPVILFIEDVSEAIYAVERMLWRLKLQGVLDSMKGIITGHFTDYRHPDLNFASVEEMVSFRLKEWGISGRIPCAIGFPVGHQQPNYPLLLGSIVELTVTPGEIILKETGSMA